MREIYDTAEEAYSPTPAAQPESLLLVRATSLGGVESLLEHRSSIEGRGSSAPETLIRCSIGLEHPDDLIADLEQALRRGH